MVVVFEHVGDHDAEPLAGGRVGRGGVLALVANKRPGLSDREQREGQGHARMAADEQRNGRERDHEPLLLQMGDQVGAPVEAGEPLRQRLDEREGDERDRKRPPHGLPEAAARRGFGRPSLWVRFARHDAVTSPS